ncbi:hypothetical protein DFH29DRAFT_982501 [Suillus ampliporus]|nr:hypothetical protein DFH29DRAFT_982501 [Suillus ampliporus]
MASDQAKNAGAVAQEHHMPPFQPYGAYSQPFPVYYDPSHPEPNGAPHPAPPYIYHYPPPGMMYPYPPPGFPPYVPPPQTNFQRVKRKQVKMACTNCANACKRCDEHRPCERCVKYGIPETCVDGVRKERQKGIKRGPYKRKNKSGNSDPATSPTPNATFETNGDPGWHPPNGVAQGPATTAPAPPPIGGGYYPPPYFYPAPPGFVPPSEGQAPPEGSPNSGAPPAMVPYYMPPPGYYGPPYYGPPGVPPPTMDPAQAELHRTSGQSAEPDPDTTSKKRSRVGKEGQSKAKKIKVTAALQESSTSSGTTGGSDQASELGHGSPAENGDA